VKRHAAGNPYGFAMDEDLRPLVQSDCAAELGLAKQRVSRAIRRWKIRGRIRTEGRVIFLVETPAELAVEANESHPISQKRANESHPNSQVSQ
jgi:hypothetical protein